MDAAAKRVFRVFQEELEKHQRSRQWLLDIRELVHGRNLGLTPPKLEAALDELVSMGLLTHEDYYYSLTDEGFEAACIGEEAISSLFGESAPQVQQGNGGHLTNEELQQKDADRYILLRDVYERTGGQENIPCALKPAAQAHGINDFRLRGAYQYLTQERLLQQFGTGYRVTLTHQGRKEVERSLRKPNEPTEHFSPAAIHLYGNVNMNIGALQSGVTNTATVQQHVGDSHVELHRTIQQLLTLADEQAEPVREDARVYLTQLQESVEAKPPRKQIIKMLFEKVKDVMGHVAKEALTELAKKLIADGLM